MSGLDGMAAEAWIGIRHGFMIPRNGMGMGMARRVCWWQVAEFAAEECLEVHLGRQDKGGCPISLAVVERDY
jgi:hypothetical protein